MPSGYCGEPLSLRSQSIRTAIPNARLGLEPRRFASHRASGAMLFFAAPLDGLAAGPDGRSAGAMILLREL